MSEMSTSVSPEKLREAAPEMYAALHLALPGLLVACHVAQETMEAYTAVVAVLGKVEGRQLCRK